MTRDGRAGLRCLLAAWIGYYTVSPYHPRTPPTDPDMTPQSQSLWSFSSSFPVELEPRDGHAVRLPPEPLVENVEQDVLHRVGRKVKGEVDFPVPDPRLLLSQPQFPPVIVTFVILPLLPISRAALVTALAALAASLAACSSASAASVSLLFCSSSGCADDDLNAALEVESQHGRVVVAESSSQTIISPTSQGARCHREWVKRSANRLHMILQESSELLLDVFAIIDLKLWSDLRTALCTAVSAPFVKPSMKLALALFE